MAGLLYYSIPTPLMIADEDFKILMKYGCFEEYAIRFRKGASLKNYFGLKGLLKLKKLEDGDCILIEYNNTAIDIFSVVKKGRHYYFFLCSFYSLIEMRIRLYDPDFNSVVTDHYKKVCAYISEMKKEEYICPPSNTLKKANMLCASMTRCVKFEHFLFKNLKYERCVSNDMLSIFRIITSLIDPNECFIQMMDRIDKPLTAVYDVLDMTLVISALLNISLHLRSEGRILALLSYSGSDMQCRICLKQDLDAERLMLLKHFAADPDSVAHKPEDDMLFGLYLALNLCHMAGWIINLTFSPLENDPIVILSIPCSETYNTSFKSETSDDIVLFARCVAQAALGKNLDDGSRKTDDRALDINESAE